MSEIAIRVEGLAKQYHIGAAQARPDTLRDAIVQAAQAPLRRIGRLMRGDVVGAADWTDTIWALKDVSFEVPRGQIVGIVGANGAGKSTLLKILSRVTSPTLGYAEIHGRIGSLLEVGTGFHPELTGRENVYLNGAILGMKKEEIARRFDEIVAFAQIERFIDTPVKHYSSGMYVRLAFAVAAHLEPEVLLVDEVLAVGDASFQKKCLGRMEDVASEGRTILFVSHNMSAVANLCTHGILLNEGAVDYSGPIDTVVENYLSRVQWQAAADLADASDRKGSGKVRFTAAWFENEAGERVSTIQSGDRVTMVCEYECSGPEALPVRIGGLFADSLGHRLFTLSTAYAGFPTVAEPGGGRWAVSFELPLMPDHYQIALQCSEDKSPHAEVYDEAPAGLSVEVIAGDFFGSGNFPKSKRKYGSYLVRQAWSASGNGAGAAQAPHAAAAGR